MLGTTRVTRQMFFQRIASVKIEGVHYKIHVKNRNSAIVIIAPHGGKIEPVTSQIAADIAGDDLSLYDFQGLQAVDSHRDLHLPSDCFDEPRAIQLVGSAEIALSVHGRKDGDDPRTVWIGGLDTQRCRRTMVELVSSGFDVVIRKPGESLAGIARMNICNRGKSKAGVQLEIPKSLRDRFWSNGELRSEFAKAVNRGIREEILASKY